MSDNLNINMILCEKADAKTGNIKKIFNTIQLNECREAKVDVVTFINGKNTEKEPFYLIYIIVKVKEKCSKKALIASIELFPEQEEKNKPLKIQIAFTIGLSGIITFERAKYELKMYKVGVKKIEDFGGDILGKWDEIINCENDLVSEYSFEVI